MDLHKKIKGTENRINKGRNKFNFLILRRIKTKIRKLTDELSSAITSIPFRTSSNYL